MSDDVKRLLLAANDEHASMVEIRQYTAQARPLVRTRRDREVLGELEDAMALYASVSEDEQKDREEFSDTMRNLGNIDNEDDECYGRFSKLMHLGKRYTEMDVKEPKELLDHIHEALEEGKECSDRQTRESEARTEREKSNRNLAFKDLNSVRKAIGLHPLPKA
ncbi:MAG: hypothetical protein ABI147_00765 [Acidobacteriaceae bacterium]